MNDKNEFCVQFEKSGKNMEDALLDLQKKLHSHEESPTDVVTVVRLLRSYDKVLSAERDLYRAIRSIDQEYAEIIGSSANLKLLESWSPLFQFNTSKEKYTKRLYELLDPETSDSQEMTPRV
ncbi:MAG: hypothetical protein A2283_11320 [Lentisphaerae bacterium RIFOXYA12_FULL_48_11]|nr:MAG: hypothetical protein A2283_11320 [Lentisphaerae bacterium RIFOXYA12_FULL_48_11]